MFDLIFTIWHWIVFYSNALIVIGLGVAGFLYSPLFKTAFLGVAVGAFALQLLNADIVSFGKQTPQYCIAPKADPNGPNKMCWKSTDNERGFGYWSTDCE